MTGKLILPETETGHSTVEWDTADAGSVEAARLMYQRLVSGEHNGLRYRAASLINGVDGEMLNGFDPTASTIMFIAPTAGG